MSQYIEFNKNYNLPDGWFDKLSNRVFNIDKDFYLIFTGTNESALFSFLRIGNSPLLHPYFALNLDYVLLPDYPLAAISVEKEYLSSFTKQYAEKSHNIKCQYFGNTEITKNFAKLCGIKEQFLLFCELDRKKDKSREMGHQVKDLANPKIISYFYENGNINVKYQNRILYNHFKRQKNDISYAAELKNLVDCQFSAESAIRKFGIIDSDGDMLIHDYINMGFVSVKNKLGLLKPLIWGFSAKYYQFVYLDKKNDDSGGLLHELASNAMFAKTKICHGDLKETSGYAQKIKPQRLSKIFDFSSRYYVECQNDLLALYDQNGSCELTFVSGRLEQYPDSKIIVSDSLANQKERQLCILRQNFPPVMANPYHLYMPKNFRYEIRSVYKAIDLVMLRREIEDCWQCVSEEKISLAARKEFLNELFFICQKLIDSVFQSYELNLDKLGKKWQHLDNDIDKHIYEQLLDFNRIYIKWQLQGKRDVFEHCFFLQDLWQQGFLFFGLVIQFIDNQMLIVYLPETMPALFIEKHSNPLYWNGIDLTESRGENHLAKAIANQDNEYFLDILAIRLQRSPFHDEIIKRWLQVYNKWIGFYLQRFDRVLTDQRRFLALLSKFASNVYQDNTLVDRLPILFQKGADRSQRVETFIKSLFAPDEMLQQTWQQSQLKQQIKRKDKDEINNTKSVKRLWFFTEYVAYMLRPIRKKNREQNLRKIPDKNFFKKYKKSTRNNLIENKDRVVVSFTISQLFQWFKKKSVLVLLILGFASLLWWLGNKWMHIDSESNQPRAIQEKVSAISTKKPKVMVISLDQWLWLYERLPYSEKLRANLRHWQKIHNQIPVYIVKLVEQNYWKPRQKDSAYPDKTLHIGERVKRPQLGDYLVQKGDNLWSLAQKDLLEMSEQFLVRLLIFDVLFLASVETDASPGSLFGQINQLFLYLTDLASGFRSESELEVLFAKISSQAYTFHKSERVVESTLIQYLVEQKWLLEQESNLSKLSNLHDELTAQLAQAQRWSFGGEQERQIFFRKKILSVFSFD